MTLVAIMVNGTSYDVTEALTNELGGWRWPMAPVIEASFGEDRKKAFINTELMVSVEETTAPDAG